MNLEYGKVIKQQIIYQTRDNIMKNILLIICIFILYTSNIYAQCLCGKLEIQICLDDLNFTNGNSNYELKILEKPTWFTKSGGTLKNSAFSNDTLKIVIPTESGIQKLILQLKNTTTKASMEFTILNMQYDNDYFIDLGHFTSGNYTFDWTKINTCQSKNKTQKIVDCDEMVFQQLVLLSEKPMTGNFNHNKIRVVDLNSFLYVNPNFDESQKGKIFNVWSTLFEINNLQCKWEYDAMYLKETNENSREILVDLMAQKLIDIKTKDVLLELNLKEFFFLYNPIPLSILDNNNFTNRSVGKYVTYPAPYSYTNDNLDVNEDGYFDFKFLTENAGGGANIAYVTYLFNPKNRQFELSKPFSGYNIRYDPQKNRISSFGKSSVYDYTYVVKNLKSNKRDIDFIENIRRYGDTIYYKKSVNGKVVEEKQIVLEEYENWRKYLERK